MSKGRHEEWELQLAALLSTSDIDHVVDFDSGSSAAVKGSQTTLGSNEKSPRRSSSEFASNQASEAVSTIVGRWKTTNQTVQIRQFTMDETGAGRCIREAVLLKRPVILDQTRPSPIPRGLQNLILPLGLWTSSHNNYLHLVLQNPGILPLSKYLENGRPLPPDTIRSILRGVLQGLELCHFQGIAHCAVNPQSIFIHTCDADLENGTGCNENCDFTNSARRHFPADPVLAQLSCFEHCLEFSPNISDSHHLTLLHSSIPAYWSAPELCSLALKPKSKSRRNTVRETGGLVDTWSVGILAMSLIERNMLLSPVARPNKELISTNQLQRLSSKEVSRLRSPPKILQARKWTPLANDFVQSCLRIDPATRPTATTLLKHPFLTNLAETCLLSDVSESETDMSTLEDTYEDSTTYIPAPDSDSDIGGSSDDEFVDEDERPNSGRSIHSIPESNPSIGRRISTEELDYQGRRPSITVSDELGTSEESSGGSVKIISHESDDSRDEDISPAPRTRRRGKSDAQKEDDTNTTLTDLAAESTTTSTHLTPSNSLKRKRSLDKGMKRLSSENLMEDVTLPVVNGEGESPPNQTLIAVHTHKVPRSPHEAPTAAGDTKSIASRRFQSPQSTSLQQPLDLRSISTNTSANAGGNPSSPSSVSGGPLSASSAPGSMTLNQSPRGIALPPRDRTPSPAKQSSPTQSTGRRSSLPLLPIGSLSKSGPSPASGGKHHPPLLSSQSSIYVLGGNSNYNSIGSSSPRSAEAVNGFNLYSSPGSSNALSYGSGGNSLSGSVTSSGGLGLTYGSPLASPLSHSPGAPGSPYSPTGSTTLHSSGKASSMNEQASSSSSQQHSSFRPSFLSRNMRSRSEDVLKLDKDTLILAQKQQQSISASSNLHQRTQTSTGFSGSPSSAAQTVPLPSPTPKDAPTATSSSSSKSLRRSKAKKQKSAGDTNTSPSTPVLATDETFDKEVEECEARWQAEIKSCNKSLDKKAKELSDRHSQRLKSIQRRYATQIASITKRDDTRSSEAKHRYEEEKTRLMAERQRELDKDIVGSSSSTASAAAAVLRRNSFSGMTHASIAMKKPQFPKQVLHINHEKSVYELERRYTLERHELEMKGLDDTSLVEREYEVQKFLLEQTHLQQNHEIQRQHMEDLYALKLKRNEEVKQMTRRYIQRKCKKLIESGARLSYDDTLGESVWQTVLLSYASPKTTSSDTLGTALSFVDLGAEMLVPPVELTSGVSERFHKTLELQKWKQDEELVSLSRDINLAEEHKAEAMAMNARHAQELRDLKTLFEVHYIRTRQSFLADRINRVSLHEFELAEMKFQHSRRVIPRHDETVAKEAEEALVKQHNADYALITQMVATKRQQLSSLVASVLPNRTSGSAQNFTSPRNSTSSAMSLSLGNLPSLSGHEADDDCPESPGSSRSEPSGAEM